MTGDISLAILAAAFAAAFFVVYLDRRHERAAWAKERETLLDRVQARDLPEFKAMTRAVEPVRPPTQEELRQAAIDARLHDDAHGLI